MKKTMICNFSVIRFLPYPETEEFVNIGVALACPERGTFDYRIEKRRHDRITHFFPEMNPQLFIDGRRMLIAEMNRICGNINDDNHPEQAQFHFSEKEFGGIFREIVKPRESLFRFSKIATVIADHPATELNELFAYYVERQFAKHNEYHETVMTRRLTEIFRAKEILNQYRKQNFGDDLYHVKIPFVHQMASGLKAIKPLDLDKQDTTRIIEHGDRWRMRVSRLKEMNDFPEEMLFVVRQQERGKHHDVAIDIRKDLEGLGVETLPMTDRDAVIEFASAI